MDYLFKEYPFLLLLLETNPGLMTILWLAESHAAHSILTKADTNEHGIVFENRVVGLD